MNKQPKRKITVQMWRPLIERLNTEATLACLNRDAYLDLVLFDESERLLAEAAGRRNSNESKTFVKRCFLDLRDHRLVSFSFSARTAEAMDLACATVNTWRDVLVNRIVYLLVAKTSSVESQLSIKIDNFRDEIFDEGWDIKGLLLGSRIAAIRSFICNDPFLAIRTTLHKSCPDTEGRLHMQPFGCPGGQTVNERGLVGLSTFLEDMHVPSTAAGQEHEKLVRELFDELDSLAVGATAAA